MALTVIPLSGLASDVVDSISAGAGGGGPRIANVQIANSSWGLLDDTAVSTDGGYVLINGSGFVSGCSVLVANSQATPVTFANSSLLRVEVPAKSASTYAVYVLNPDGGTAIGINALTYSAFPAWATGSTLSSGSADVEISVQLSASDATTYTLQAGSSLPANTTLASNGLFSGTITGVNEETTYTFTVEATDAQNQNTPRTFSITITVGDSYFKNTTLLLNADANTYVRDASDNAFAITVNGDTRPSAFSPYNTNWSNYFDGTGDYLTIPYNSAWDFGTGNFTIESWVYPTTSGTVRVIAASFTNSGNDGWSLELTTGNLLTFYAESGYAATSSATVPANTWTHVAVSRSGSTLKLFVNGVESASVSYSTSIAGFSGLLAISGTQSGTYLFTGYQSNFRIVTGSAVYTSAFTPSTTPLTAITNTSLLTCKSNRFIDNSTNNFTITKNGDTAVKSFGPFTETDVTTGSGYFDGSGDYLSVPDSVAFDYGTGSLTLEAWIYTAVKVDYQNIIGTFDGGSAGWYIHTNVSGTITFGLSPSVSYTGSRQVCDNAWHHVALVRNGSSDLRLYVDGVLDSTVTSSVNVINPVEVRIGSLSSGFLRYFTGYITDVRVIKGTAVYTSAFTPPTAPLTAVANTQLLTLQNRTGITNHQFVDESGTNSIITKNGNVSQGSFSPYSPAGWSGYFTGSSTSYISTPSTTILNQGQTYTVQCWIYPTSFTTSTSAVRRMYLFIKGVIYAGLSIHSDGTLGWYGWPSPGGIIVASSAGTITTNVWQHVALVVNPGNYIKLFKNGTEVGTASYTATGQDGQPIIIGHGDTSQGTDGFVGYISNFKITLSALTGGQLDYSSSPTVSSTSNAALLVLQTSRFNDSSANNLTITPAAATSIQAFSPFKPHTITANTHSVYFDGSGDYLSVPDNSAFAYGTGDFTIEFWFYMSAVAGSGNYYVLYDGRPSSTNGLYVNLAINNATPESYVNGSTVISGSALSAGIWYHFAYARSGSSTKMFINGSQVGSTYTDTTNYINGADRPVIGTNGFNVAQYNFNGYISNVRIVKGTAVYTSAFTPSTTPLTAISNTVLLTCQSTTIIDNSTNAFTITATGNVIPSKFNPFGETIAQGVEYRANTHGGSAYFDGTDDNLITSSSSNLALDSGDFTIEMWVYPNNTSSAYRGLIASDAYSGTTNGWTVYQYGTNIEMYYSSGGSTPNIFTASSVLVAGVWQHVAISRSSGTLKCFVNGVQVASVSNSIAFVGSIIYIGDNNAGNYFYSGYISDVRIVKGTALYKAAFIPPTTTLGAIKETVLLLNNDRGGIMDVSSRNILECVGNARVSTDTKKYGTGSFYFDGTGDYLLPPPSQNFAFRTGDFTIELWIKTSSTADDGILQISTTAGGFATSYTNGLMLTSYLGTLYWALNGSSVNTSTTINDGNWHHIAMTRSGSTVRVFKNGTQISTATNAGDVQGTNLVIGGYYTTSYTLEGYIDDLRITKGVARYTTNFTAPTSAHQTK